MTPSRESKIEITVHNQFFEERSLISQDRYFFAYTITIYNHGPYNVKLISRHWVVENSAGDVFEVMGEGVVGEQPVINIGESYTYTSGTEINTPTGCMQGTYQMLGPDANLFDAKIPKFLLQMPRTLH